MTAAMGFILQALTGMKEKAGATYVVLFLVIAVNLWQIERMLGINERMSTMVATEYAYDVVAYGLKDAESETDIIDSVVEWKRLGWGAQVGGVKTICDNAPFRFDAIMSEATKRMVCRIAQ